MDIRNKIRQKLIEGYGGPFNTYLEHKYEEIVTENLMSDDYKLKHEWVTYNQVIIELKHNLKDALRVKELQYKLTDDVPPKQACIEVINEVSGLSPELLRLYNKIKNF